MRFHYVPTTYRGKKFGRGYFGGSYIGYGRICGGSLADLGFTPKKIDALTNTPVNIPVSKEQVLDNIFASAPPALTPELIERARKIIAYAEATGKAQPITKKEAGFWSGVKNLGSKAWNATKAVGKTALKGAWTATKYGVPLALKTAATVAPIALSAAAFASTNPLGKAALDYISPSIASTIDKIIPEEHKTEIKNYNRDMLFKDIPAYQKMKRLASKPLVQAGLNYIAPKIDRKIIDYIPGPIGDVIEALRDDYDKKQKKEFEKEQKKILESRPEGNFYGPTNTPEEIEEYYNDNPEEKSYLDDDVDEEEEEKKELTMRQIVDLEHAKDAGEDGDTIDLIKNGKLQTRRYDRDLYDGPLKTLAKGAKGAWNGFKSWLGIGSGYRRRRKGRLRKGSIEAKLYMARLRAMRGSKKRTKMNGGKLHKNLTKILKGNTLAWGAAMPNLYTNFRGSGLNGGMFRGVSVSDLKNYYKAVKSRKIPGTRKVNIEWKDAKGNKKTTTTTKQNLHNMLVGTKRMRNYFSSWERNAKGKLRKLKNERSPEEQKKLRLEAMKNHNRMKLRWPYKKMTKKRLKEILRTFKEMEYEKLQNYWKERTQKDKNKKFYHRWFTYNYFNETSPKSKRSGYFPKKGNARNIRDLISVVRLERMKKEGRNLTKETLKSMANKKDDLVITLTKAAMDGFAKDPSVGTANTV